MALHRRPRPRLVIVVAAGVLVAAGGAAIAVTRAGPAPRPVAADRPTSPTSEPASSPSVAPGVPAHRVLRGDLSFPGGFTVPAGQVWEFAPDASATVTSGANVVVEGVLRMRPAGPDIWHTLRFTGIDERRFVGGGMTVQASDVGLWVMGAGQLDLAGSAKAGWNRTGTDPGWRAGDDLRLAPTARGDTSTFARFTPGAAVPSVSSAGRSYRAEVLNLSRNVRIEGTGDGGPSPARNGRAHIFIRSTKPQSIRYAELRHLGPRRPATQNPTEPVLGRYGLHFHMAGEGSRGSLVEGVVVRDSGSHAFVPHASHGITFRDTIAFNTFEDAYWWDPDETEHAGPNASNGIRFEHAMAALLRFDPTFRGYTLAGFVLGEGRDLSVTDSVGVGIQGNDGASAFTWPANANGSRHNMWTFTNNVGHNNRADGIRVWQNDGNPHTVSGFVSYRNGDFGVDHGAYVNNFRYENVVAFENGSGGIRSRAAGGGRPQEWRGLDTDGITLGEHVVRGNLVLFSGLTLRGPVIVDENAAADEGRAVYEFRNARTGDGRELTPADFTVRRQVSPITVYRANGTSFTI